MKAPACSATADGGAVLRNPALSLPLPAGVPLPEEVRPADAPAPEEVPPPVEAPPWAAPPPEEVPA